ncbi:MAG: hypothetical protein ABI402_06445 [Ferruginibacter sp.]
MGNIRKIVVYILLLVLVVYAFCILSDKHPLTSREGSALAPLSLMQKGHSPYDLSYLPAYYYSYFFFQQYISLPVVKIFGLNLIVLRILGHLFILGACFMFFKASRKISGNKSLSILATIILYAGSLYLNTSEVRADAYGLFFYIAAISAYFIFDNKYLRPSVIVFASLFGFFSKYYFIASLFIVLVYELMIFSRKRLGILVFISILFSGISILLLWKFLPGYYTVYLKPFMVTGAMYKKDLLFSFKQFALFLVLLAPLIITVIAFAGKKMLTKIPFNVLFSKNKFDSISIAEKTESYLVWGVIASTGGTIFFLATNIGNQMTYLMHLMLAWYLWYALFLYKKFNIPEIRFYNTAVACLLFFVILLRPWNYFTKSKGDWQKVYSYIDKHNQVFAPAEFADYIIRTDKELYNSGHTLGFPALEKYSIFLKDDSMVLKHTDPEIMEASNRFYEMMTSNIQNKKFDLIIIDNTLTIGHFMKDIQTNYKKTDSCSVYMPHSRHLIEVEMYEPKGK